MLQKRLLLMGACLLLIAALGSSQANAQEYETWSGACTFTVKITNQDGPPGNQKFVTQSQTISGTMKMYIGLTGPTPNQEGYYLQFIESGVTTLGITDLVAIRTDVTKSMSDKVLVIGVGPFFQKEDPVTPAGLAYLDASGTIKKDKTGKITAISLTMKFAGGDVDGRSVWNCAPKVTLTKQ